MSKSIYDKVLDILVNSITDPQDEDNNCYMLNYKEINLIIDTIKEAKKQERLLELYKELSLLERKRATTLKTKNTLKYTQYNMIIDLLNGQIKELENAK